MLKVWKLTLKEVYTYKIIQYNIRKKDSGIRDGNFKTKKRKLERDNNKIRKRDNMEKENWMVGLP